MIITLFLGLFVGFPLAFVLIGVPTIFGVASWGTSVFPMYVSRIYGLMSNYTLIAIPLFIFMGCMLEKTRLAEDLFDGMGLIFNRLRGGLAIGTVLISIILAATTGIIAASVTAGGLLALPEMLKHNYQKELSLGTIAASGSLGIIIPPSIMLILYAAEAGLSVGKLFAGAILPGVGLAIIYILYIGIKCYLQPDVAPIKSKKESDNDGLIRLIHGLRGLLPASFLILSVLGAIFTGIVTPTEAAGAGSVGSIIIALAYRRLDWKKFKETVYLTLQITSMAMTVVVGATCFTGVFLGLGGGEAMTNIFSLLGFGPIGSMILMMLIIFILGMFIDWMGILLICLPLFLPIADNFGFDPLWFAIMICINLQMSFLTPPFGYALFVLKGISPPSIDITDIYKGIIPFVILQAITLILCGVYPNIILWLPKLLVG